MSSFELSDRLAPDFPQSHSAAWVLITVFLVLVASTFSLRQTLGLGIHRRPKHVITVTAEPASNASNAKVYNIAKTAATILEDGNGNTSDVIFSQKKRMSQNFDDACIPVADAPKRKLANTEYTVGWICAVKVEHVAAEMFLDEKHEDPEDVLSHDNNNYTLGKVGKHNVAIAVLPKGGFGIAAATSAARDMLHTFPNIRLGLMVGIGGGAPSQKHDIRLGDIVVSAPHGRDSGVFQYDLGKTIQDQKFVVTGALDQPPMVLRTAIHGLEKEYEIKGHQFDKVIDHILKGNQRLQRKYKRPEPNSDKLYRSDVLHPPEHDSGCVTVCGDSPSKLIARRQRSKDEDDPAIHYGLIASANQLMKDASVRDKIAAEKDVLCFEMEAAGLMNHFPCLVIRGICDYSDTHKNDIWQGYAAMVAAAYAKDLLKKIAPNKINNEKRLSELILSVSRKAEDIHQLATETSHITKLIQDDNHLNKIRIWLAPPDPSINLNQAQSLHHRGTGQWFLNSNAYSEWKKEAKSFLWLNGIPGCGKTVLSSTIITDLDPTNSDPRVLYFFFNFNDEEKRSAEKAIRSLIFQLYSKHTILRSEVDAVYSSFGDGTRQPDAPALDQLLRDMLSKTEEIYIVLDALDESERHGGSYSSKSLLDWIKDLQDEPINIHVLVTSRPEQHITASFNGWAHSDKIIELQSGLVSDDITAYTKARVSEMPRWKKRPEIQKKIEATLLEKADGMFRWVSCQFDTLEQCLDPPSVRRELQNLPQTLDATYAQILRRIHPDHISTAKRLLQFLTYSDRPLKLEEAVDLIAVEPSSQPAFTRENRMPIPEEIIQYCSSLVVLSHKGKRVTEIQLAHFSVQEYLLSSRLEPDIAKGLDKLSAKASIVDVCLSYLLTIHELCSPEEARAQFYLAEYSARYWMKHAKDVELSNKASLPLAKEYFLCQNAFAFGCQLNDQEKIESGWNQVLYYASLWGLFGSCIFLLQKGVDVNAQGGFYGNALQAASAEGYQDIIEMLIQHGADVNAQGGFYGNALYAALEGGHGAIAKMLIQNGADVNAQRGRYSTALYVASERGYQDIVEMLIHNGANVNTQRGRYSNALYAASERGYQDIAEMLIQNGADINAQGGKCGNALYAALAQGYHEIAKMLIQNGANVHAQSGRYGNALYVASERGYQDIVEELIHNGANINARGGYYSNALQAASAQGHREIAEMLVQNGADVNAQGGKYSTALYTASKGGHREIVEMLIQHGANVNAQGGFHGNALYAASEGGRHEIAKMLIQNGANVNAQDGFCGNALQAASEGGRREIAKMLIQNGAVVNAQGGFCGNALQAASAQGHREIAEMLIQHGADVNAQGGKYGNALYATSERGYQDIAEMLIQNGADINAQGGEYGNALHAALAWGNHRIAEMLIQNGANVHAQSGRYGNALYAASERGYQDIAEMLIHNGANVNAQGGYYSSALQAASARGHSKIIQMLIRKGAHVNARDAEAGGAEPTDGDGVGADIQKRNRPPLTRGPKNSARARKRIKLVK